ncbi:MAG TPA: SGNH/GDSL hydrolase family protein [Kiloniellales bacterium]
MSWKSVALYSTIIVATLVGAEAVARIIDWRATTFQGAAGDGFGADRYYHSWSGAGDLVPNQDGHWVIWFHRPYHVQTNSLGLRSTEEPLDKAFRIYAIGDSQTFGPYLANEDTWPGWTQNYLRQRYRDADRVQVFNAGIAGYTLSDEIALLREKAIDFKPSLVLLAVFENDLFDLRDVNGQRPSNDARSRLKILLKSLTRESALFSIVNKIKIRMQFAAAQIDIRRGEGATTSPADPTPDSQHLVDSYSELYGQAVKLLTSNGIPLAVIFIPARHTMESESLMQTVIERLTRESGTPFLDLTPILRTNSNYSERFYLMQREPGGGFSGNGHLSREGGEQVGLAVADWLFAQNLIPQ